MRAAPTWARRPLLHLAAALCVTVVLAGCGGAVKLADTNEKLAAAGARGPDLELRQTRDEAVRALAVVAYRTGAEGEAMRREADRLARIVWTNLPARFDALELQPRSPATSRPTVIRYSRAELERSFGRRPAGLDRTLADTGRDIMIQVVIGLAVIVCLAGALAVFVIRLLRRHADRPPPVQAPPLG